MMNQKGFYDTQLIISKLIAESALHHSIQPSSAITGVHPGSMTSDKVVDKNHSLVAVVVRFDTTTELAFSAS